VSPSRANPPRPTSRRSRVDRRPDVGRHGANLRPLAIRAMAEIGIDISGQHSKTLDR
jgi:hypothetical protein